MASPLASGCGGGGGGSAAVDGGARDGPIELMVMESVSPAAVPTVATHDAAKRAAAYAMEGRHDLALLPGDGLPPPPPSAPSEPSADGALASGGDGASEEGRPRTAPRAAAYAWKRARWFEACLRAVLVDEARAALPFGSRPSDFCTD